jgi:hypothetical protein
MTGILRTGMFAVAEKCNDYCLQQRIRYMPLTILTLSTFSLSNSIVI